MKEFWSKELEDFYCEKRPSESREQIKTMLMEVVKQAKNKFETDAVFLSIDKANKEIKVNIEV